MVAQGTDVESPLNTLRESWEVCSPHCVFSASVRDDR
jgi:hypothetical protein